MKKNEQNESIKESMSIISIYLRDQKNFQNSNNSIGRSDHKYNQIYHFLSYKTSKNSIRYYKNYSQNLENTIRRLSI